MIKWQRLALVLGVVFLVGGWNFAQKRWWEKDANITVDEYIDLWTYALGSGPKDFIVDEGSDFACSESTDDAIILTTWTLKDKAKMSDILQEMKKWPENFEGWLGNLDGRWPTKDPKRNCILRIKKLVGKQSEKTIAVVLDGEVSMSAADIDRAKSRVNSLQRDTWRD